MKTSIPDIVRACEFYDNLRISKLLNDGLNLDKRVVDSKKVSDHHAVIPTTEIDKLGCAEFKKSLSAPEKEVAKLVIDRFLTALSQPYIYKETQYLFENKSHIFKLVSKEPISLGWREYEKTSEKDKPINKIVKYQVGDTFSTLPKVIEKETTPPKHFTESTLLSAMENISKRIDDKEKAAFVKERGLGTPATRANIFEELLRKGFIERKNKQLVSTEKGKQLILKLPDGVKSAQITADMESRLADIESGEVTPKQVIDEIVKKLNGIIAEEKSRPHAQISKSKGRPEKESLGKCPDCGGNVYESEKSYFCGNYKEGCKFSLWKNDKFWSSKSKKLTTSIIKSLLSDGKVKVSDFTSEKTGKKYAATISIEKKQVGEKIYYNFKMEFDNFGKKEKNEPKHKRAKM